MIEPTEEMLEKGEFVLSEWLNDNAPIGQHLYRKPAEAAFKAMMELAPNSDNSFLPFGMVAAAMELAPDGGSVKLLGDMRTFQHASWNQYLEDSDPATFKLHKACKDAADSLQELIDKTPGYPHGK